MSSVSLSEVVVTDTQWNHLVQQASPPQLQGLHLATVFVLQEGEQHIATTEQFVEALSCISELSLRMVLKQDIYEGFFDSKPNFYLELFKKIDSNQSQISSLDLDSQVLQDIPPDLFSSALSKIENINLTDGSLTSAQVASLVSLTSSNLSFC